MPGSGIIDGAVGQDLQRPLGLQMWTVRDPIPWFCTDHTPNLLFWLEQLRFAAFPAVLQSRSIGFPALVIRKIMGWQWEDTLEKPGNLTMSIEERPPAHS